MSISMEMTPLDSTFLHTVTPDERRPLVNPHTRRRSISPAELEELNKDPSRWSNIKSQCLQFLEICGPGFVVAIGYMDPGNWATDLVSLLCIDFFESQSNFKKSTRAEDPNSATLYYQ